MATFGPENYFNMNKLIISFLTIALSAGYSAYAQDKDTTVNQLEEVVISATKTESKIINIPTRVQNVPVYKMKANNVFMVDDILSQISGVNVSRSDGVYSKKSTVSLRGMGSDQGRTLVLVDGVPYNKYSTGSVNWNMINPYDVERIEVVKGPGSSLYGGNAMGGTINIITRKPQKGIHGHAAVDYGQYNTIGANAGVNGSNEYIFGGVSGSYRHGDGFNAYPEELRDSTTIKSPVDEYSVSGFIGWNINKNNTIQFNGSWYDGKRGTGDRIFLENETIDAKGRYQDQEYRLKYNGHGKNNTWEISGFYLDEKMSETKYKSKNLYDVVSDRADWGAWANYTHNIGSHLRLLAGLEYKGGFVDGKDIYRTSEDVVTNRGKSDNFAALIQAELNFFEGHFAVIPTIRYDISHFHDAAYTIENASKATSSLEQFISTDLAKDAKWIGAVSPKLSLQYKFNEGSRIYASVSSGWRPGSLEDMCWFGVTKKSFSVANPLLKPETIYTYEIGGDVMALGNFTMSASAYYSDGRDFIYQVGNGETIKDGKTVKPVMQYQNIGRAQIYGGEIDLVYNNLFTKGLDIFGNYTYTHATIKEYKKTQEDDNDITGMFMTYTPMHMTAAGVTYRSKYINATVAYNWMSKQFMSDDNSTKETDIVKAHGSLNAKIWYTLKNMVTFAIGGNNLIGETYYSSKDQLSMGRYIYGKIEFRF